MRWGQLQTSPVLSEAARRLLRAVDYFAAGLRWTGCCQSTDALGLVEAIEHETVGGSAVNRQLVEAMKMLNVRATSMNQQ